MCSAVLTYPDPFGSDGASDSRSACAASGTRSPDSKRAVVRWRCRILATALVFVSKFGQEESRDGNRRRIACQRCPLGAEHECFHDHHRAVNRKRAFVVFPAQHNAHAAPRRRLFDALVSRHSFMNPIRSPRLPKQSICLRLTVAARWNAVRPSCSPDGAFPCKTPYRAAALARKLLSYLSGGHWDTGMGEKTSFLDALRNEYETVQHSPTAHAAVEEYKV